jgi:phosphoribosylformimino-5-aminoimidazole carboxamide ribotide isomerase
VFRPCIDLRGGKVVQIVGGTLTDDGSGVRTNFVSERPARWYAERYRDDQLTGGHVIQLGSGNAESAREALAAWPGGLQLGGGVTLDNAVEWLDAGASHVIVTSWLFPAADLDRDRLRALSNKVGPNRLVLDLSCRKRDGDYLVAMDRWQRFTRTKLGPDLFGELAPFCAEFLVHAVDVEGLCRGVDLELVRLLGRWSPLPVTYAGGARSVDDLSAVDEAGGGKVDLTIGSALDIFGGHGAAYADCVDYNRRRSTAGAPP